MFESYELTNDYEINSLLSDLPLDLMIVNVKEQVETFQTSTDYMEIIMEKYNMLEEYLAETNPEALPEVRDNFFKIFEELILVIKDKLDLEIDIEAEYENLPQLTYVLYRFFILDFKSILTNFLYEFIRKNKKQLIAEYIGTKKKDVTTLRYKKQMSKEDVIIITNLPDIINDIKSLEIDSDDFITYILNDESYEAEYIHSLMRAGRITGDIFTKFMDQMYDNVNGLSDEIYTNIKIKLLKIL